MGIFVTASGESIYSTLLPLTTSQIFAHRQREPIRYQLQRSNGPIQDALLSSDGNDAVVVEIQDRARTVETLKALSHIKLPCRTVIPATAILACATDACLVRSLNLPETVSDWVRGPISPHDIACRILRDFKRKGIEPQVWQNGELRLREQGQVLCYSDREVALPPTQFMLARVLFDRIGSVVPLSELEHLSSGRSCNSNNIRVAMFELRLKLKVLTKSHYVLANVHRQGYCIRQKIRSFPIGQRSMCKPAVSQESLGMLLVQLPRSG